MENRLVAKPKWGIKRICTSCGAKFYDLEKDPIVCPACDAIYDPDAAAKLKRAQRGVEPEAKAKPAAAAAAASEGDDAEDTDLDLDDDDEDVLEDTDDLDEDDVGVVAGDEEEDS